VRLALGGPMAVGKTTLGRGLAAHLALPFVDLDERIVQTAGRSVAELFEQEGEAGFRARELRALAEALTGPRFVLALGGGALHSPGAPEQVSARARLLMLWAPFAELSPRLGAGPGRPLQAEAEARFDRRAPLEARLGERVDLSGLSASAALSTLLGVVASAGAPGGARA
jgi:shikimate kinase